MPTLEPTMFLQSAKLIKFSVYTKNKDKKMTYLICETPIRDRSSMSRALTQRLIYHDSGRH